MYNLNTGITRDSFSLGHAFLVKHTLVVRLGQHGLDVFLICPSCRSKSHALTECVSRPFPAHLNFEKSTCANDFHSRNRPKQRCMAKKISSLSHAVLTVGLCSHEMFQ